MSGDPAVLEELEELCRSIGSRLGAVCDEHEFGFALLVFDFEADGWTTYISNAEPEDMVRVLRDTARRIESGRTADVGTAGRLPS